MTATTAADDFISIRDKDGVKLYNLANIRLIEYYDGKDYRFWLSTTEYVIGKPLSHPSLFTRL
jgi:hypothetical protein